MSILYKISLRPSINDVVSRVFLCTNKDSKTEDVGPIGANVEVTSYLDSPFPKLVNTNFISDVRRYEELFDPFFHLTFSPTLRNYIFRRYTHLTDDDLIFKNIFACLPPVDLYLNFEKLSWKNQVRRSGFLACKHQFRN